MESDKLARALDLALPKISIEKRRFGRSADLSIWVEFKSLGKVSRTLSSEPTLAFDWLENFSIIEVNEALVASYFLRSRKTGANLVLRATVVPADAASAVSVPSVADCWPEAEAMEDVASELFGIRFGDRPPSVRLGTQAFHLRRAVKLA